VLFLAWRDIKLRYRQTALGVTWAVLQPLATMVVFTVVFSRLARVPSDGVPYPLWSYAGLVPWMYVVNAVGLAAASIVSNVSMVTKVYFPRLVLPLAAVLAGLLDFAVASTLLVGFLAWYGVAPGSTLLAWPVFLVSMVAVALGVGLWLAALNVRYRDVRYVVPFLTQFWLFVTPVAYPSSVLHEPWRALAGLNPMAGVVEGFRWALLGTSPSPGLLVLSAASTCAVLAGALAYLHRVESDFADVI